MLCLLKLEMQTLGIGIKINMPITREYLCVLEHSSFWITFSNSVDQDEQQIKFEIRKLRHLDIYLSAEIPFRYETNICSGMARETSTNSVPNAFHDYLPFNIHNFIRYLLK